MGFDWRQRISGAIAIIAFGCFAAFTLERHGSSVPTATLPAAAPAPVPTPIIEQKATDSVCSNVVAGGDAKVDCPAGKENGSAKKHPNP
jgi:hypothetical protein